MQMRASGKNPDCNVFPSLLKACTFSLDVRLGRCVHGCVIRLGVDYDLCTNNALLNMYAKFNRLNENVIERSNVFDKMPERIRSGEKVCENGNGDFMGEVKRRRMRMNDVRKVLDLLMERVLVSWNTVIAGSAQNGMYEEALMMVREMGNANLKPDTFTLSSLLPVIAEFGDVGKGKEIHGYAIRCGLDGDLFIGSALIDMYAKCTRVEDSLMLFNILPHRDSISWNSIIAGCVQNGLFDDGLIYFRQMLKAQVKPVPVSFSSICACLLSLNNFAFEKAASRIHNQGRI